jgi:hypothetical protein
VIRAGQAIDTTGHVATFVVKPGDVVDLARRH